MILQIFSVVWGSCVVLHLLFSYWNQEEYGGLKHSAAVPNALCILLLKSVRIWGMKHSAAVPNIRIWGLKHSAAVPITLRRVRDVKSYLRQMRKKSAVNNQSYLHDFSLSLTGLLLRESTSNEHEIRLWCLVLTNLPTTFPRCRTSNTNSSGTRRLPSETANPAPAPYRGTLFPWRFTVTTRWLFLGW